jgi:Uma2 family endonuclease
MPEVQDATEEVIDGEIRITPPAKFIHAWTVSKIRHSLLGQFEEPKFFVLTAQFGVVIRKAHLTVRVPDLAVFEIGTIVGHDGFIHSPPRLVAEVLAPGEDIRRKLADYARPGVPEVRVVSPESRTIEVLIWENGNLDIKQTHSQGTFTSPHYPPVTVNVEDLWSNWPPQWVE